MSEIGITADAQPIDDYATIPDVPIRADNSIVNPNQVRSGVQRGTQTIVGTDNSKITQGQVDSTAQLAIAQYDSIGRKVSQYGQQADGANALKFFDANGIGNAQFGKYANGTIALKVAKAGIEVGTATNDQLIFNSAQNVFKIVNKLTATIPSFTIGTAATNYGVVTIPHGLSYTPLLNAYASGAWFKGDAGVNLSTYIPLPVPKMAFPVGGYLFPGTPATTYYPLSVLFASDATNIYFQAGSDSTAAIQTITAIPVTYFILQETAT